MAELRTTEDELSKIILEYKKLRRRIPLLTSNLLEPTKNESSSSTGSSSTGSSSDFLLPSLKEEITKLYPPSTTNNNTKTEENVIERKKGNQNDDKVGIGNGINDSGTTITTSTDTTVNDTKSKKPRKHISWGDTPVVSTEGADVGHQQRHDKKEENKSKDKPSAPPPPPSAPMTALEKAFLKQAQKWGNTKEDNNDDGTTSSTISTEKDNENEKEKKTKTKISFSNDENNQTRISAPSEQQNTINTVLIDDDNDDANDNDKEFLSLSQLEQMKMLIESIISIDRILVALEPKMEKYNQRLLIVDPVTGHSRYGSATRQRVIILTQTYGALKHIRNNASQLSTLKDKLIHYVQTTKRQIQEETKQKEEQELAARQEEEQKQKQQEEERQRIEQERLQREEEERQQLALRAEEARRQREEQQRAEEEAYRIQRNEEQRYMNSISKTEEGMKQQLVMLKESCASSSSSGGGAYMNAITALHTLISQIVSYPEEVKFRRIRRNHEQFYKDIGQYNGGEGFLISCGFRYTRMIMNEDNPIEVNALVSTEPNLETNMDEWSEWFNRNKKAIDVLEDAMINS